jgi:hypothetical protein
MLGLHRLLPFAIQPLEITFSLLLITQFETYVTCLIKLHLIQLWYFIQWHKKLIPSYRKIDRKHQKTSALSSPANQQKTLLDNIFHQEHSPILSKRSPLHVATCIT